MFEDELKDFINSKKINQKFPNIEDGIESLKLAIQLKKKI